MAGVMTLIQNIHAVKGLDPVADFNDTTQYSDVVNVTNWGSVVFLYYKGVGATGTSTLTVEACDDVVPTNTTAVPFFYKTMIGSDDVSAAIARATSTGFATTAGSSQLYVIEVRGEDIVSTGRQYCRLKCAEVVNSPVLGGIAIIMANPRYAQDIPVSVIV